MQRGSDDHTRHLADGTAAEAMNGCTHGECVQRTVFGRLMMRVVVHLGPIPPSALRLASLRIGEMGTALSERRSRYVALRAAGTALPVAVWAIAMIYHQFLLRLRYSYYTISNEDPTRASLSRHTAGRIRR